MRIFVSFENAVHAIDVNVGEAVGEIKASLQEKFGINLKNSQNKTDCFVALTHQGTNLQDSWTYSDLGIPAGTILACRIEKRIEPTLKVFCPRYEEAIEYKESFRVWQTLVATLRVMIQNSTGIHVSTFRLFSPAGVEMFDCHPLKVYGIHAGDTVTMEIWHDVADLVKAARANDITDTLRALASFHEAPHLLRYHLQLGLFIAAHFGYYQLASQLMKCGARPNEPIGQHPSRDWCRAHAHPDNAKTPSHEAAQHGQLTCLHHFLMFNYAVLICKDAHGLTPCNVARKHKQTECFKLLVAEQFRIPTVNELSISVYSRVRRWCDRARDRARVHKDKTTLLLLTNAEVERRTAIVGQKVRVDGYSGGDGLKQEENIHDRRRVKSTGSSSSDGSSKSQSQGYKGNARITKENVKGGSARVNNSLPTTPLSLEGKPKREVTCVRNNSTRLNRATPHQTTKTRFARQGGSVPLEITSRSPGTSPSRNNVATAEYKREESKERYVWKPFKPTDCTKDNDNDNDSVFKEKELEEGGRPSLSANGVQGSGSVNRRLNHTINSLWSDNEIGDNENNVRKNNYGKENEGCGARCKQSADVTNGTGVVMENGPLREVADVARLGKQSTSSKSGNHGRHMRRSLPSLRQSSNFSIDMRRHDSLNNLYQRSAFETLPQQRSVDSAHECLRVARETYQRKSWLGQLQMALVVNTNMHKRRHSNVEKQAEVPEQ